MSIQFVSRDHYLPSYQVMNLVQMQMNVSRITFDHLSKLVFEKSSMMIRSMMQLFLPINRSK